jgi:diguanylate cyclase (GGDEF)-like protein/PAS domain S-box-containing protein
MSENQGTILIIDDSLESTQVLKAVLEEEQYEVYCAQTGKEGIAKAETLHPDLILLDILLPDITGYRVSRYLTSQALTGDIPIVFLSALHNIPEKIEAFRSGASDYINKPFHLEELLSRVKSRVALRRDNVQIKQLNNELKKQIQYEELELKKAIDECQRIQQLLKVSEKRLETILTSLDEVVCSFSAISFELLYLNPAAEKMYGRPVGDFFVNPDLWIEIMYPLDRINLQDIHQKVLEQGEIELDYRILRPNGEYRWLRDRRRVVYDVNGRPLRLDGIISDITERKHAEERLLYQAHHDPLTGLYNRTWFMNKLEQAVMRNQVLPHQKLAILFIDLDRFKVINDSLGHSLGDELLISIAKRLKNTLRETDDIARLGGDEFTVLVERIHTSEDAVRVAERLLSALSEPFTLQGRQVFTNASIGIAFSSPEYTCGVDLLRDADIAMYQAKARGKGCYAVFNQEMYHQALKTLQIESEIRKALEREEFVLYYQPIISLAKGHLSGFEALVRWKHPERGMVLPQEFISVAEETGLIVLLGEWVLRESCKQLSQWKALYPFARNLKVSVNLAGRQLKDKHLLSTVDTILEETGLDGSNLQLEITETMLVENQDTVLQTLIQLRARRIQLSLDDFGTGYSSLSYLHRFPVDNLKIDRAFVGRLDSTCPYIGSHPHLREEDDYEIIRTIAMLAHALGLKVIAEGVETPHQLEILKGLGCEFGQGYLFNQPLDAENAEVFLLSAWELMVSSLHPDKEIAVR